MRVTYCLRCGRAKRFGTWCRECHAAVVADLRERQALGGAQEECQLLPGATYPAPKREPRFVETRDGVKDMYNERD